MKIASYHQRFRRGESNEKLIVEILQDYLPIPTYRIITGEIVSRIEFNEIVKRKDEKSLENKPTLETPQFWAEYKDAEKEAKSSKRIHFHKIGTLSLEDAHQVLKEIYKRGKKLYISSSI